MRNEFEDYIGPVYDDDEEVVRHGPPTKRPFGVVTSRNEDGTYTVLVRGDFLAPPPLPRPWYQRLWQALKRRMGW